MLHDLHLSKAFLFLFFKEEGTKKERMHPHLGSSFSPVFLSHILIPWNTFGNKLADINPDSGSAFWGECRMELRICV